MKHYFLENPTEVGKNRIEAIATDLKLHKNRKCKTEFEKILERKNKYIKGVNTNE